VIIFYYQPTFRPPIQVGFFRAVFSTTKHVAYQLQETMSSMTYKDKKRKAGQVVIRMVTLCLLWCHP